MRWLTRWVDSHSRELTELRRHIHSNPELAFAEHATTEFVLERLKAAGLKPRRLPRGTGLVVDIGDGPETVALRADLDALPLDDLKDVPYQSIVGGTCHACGHDAHTAIALGAALALAEAPTLPGRVRIIFQPAEETIGGAREVVAAGELDGVGRIFALHCDPRLRVGQVGLKPGPLTAACDLVTVHLTGPGGHTARPHLTVDLVDALARIAVDAPALLARRIDVRDTMALTWGAIQAGDASNVIPSSGLLRGTVRVLNRDAWDAAEKTVTTAVVDVAAVAGAGVEVDYQPGVPPVVNDVASTEMLRTAVTAELGPAAIAETRVSMGGEDFAWYGDHAPTAMARLGTHSKRLGSMRDLHQGNFDIDERCLTVGVRVLVRAAITALVEATRP